MRIILASNNQHKVDEFKKVLLDSNNELIEKIGKIEENGQNI